MQATRHLVPTPIIEAIIAIQDIVCKDGSIARPAVTNCTEYYNGKYGELLFEVDLHFVHTSNPSKWVQVGVFSDRFFVIFDSLDGNPESVRVMGDITSKKLLHRVADMVVKFVR